MVNYLLESLAAYRSIQGWGSVIVGEGALSEIITQRDLTNAIDLGLAVLQRKYFRQVTPCYGISTDVMNGEECWYLVEDELRGGGGIDPADIFLGLYGYDELDWRKVFSQALNSAVERLSLRWMEHIGLIKLIELAEKAGEAVFSFANELIDRSTMTWRGAVQGLAEGVFDNAGIPETLYRHLEPAHRTIDNRGRDHGTGERSEGRRSTNGPRHTATDILA